MYVEESTIGRPFSGHHGFSMGFPHLFWSSLGYLWISASGIQALECRPMATKPQHPTEVLGTDSAAAQSEVCHPDSALLHSALRWICLKMGYTPNYSHLVGIMIINHWV